MTVIMIVISENYAASGVNSGVIARYQDLHFLYTIYGRMLSAEHAILRFNTTHQEIERQEMRPSPLTHQVSSNPNASPSSKPL